jgi:cytoskeletal protein RodZ
MSSGFGGALREARERRGVSLRQIANATKISVAALEALERNDISRLPGGIFSRAFVRSYAIEVGLDPDVTIQEFVAQFPNDSVTAGHPATDRGEDHEAVESDRRLAGTLLWLILVSIPIAGAVLYFATAGRSAVPEAPPPVAVTSPAAETKPVTDPLSAPASTPAPAPTSSPSEQPAPPAVATPPSAVVPAVSDRLAVSLSVKRPCYVSATVDGRKTIERLLQPGDRQTIEVRREMVLTAGDASAIALRLNGVEARPLGKTGEVVTARFNLTNFKDYLPGR